MNERDATPTELVFICDEQVRLDKFLVDRLPNLSRTRIQALIKEGFVTVNQALPRKSGQILSEHSVIQVIIPPSRESEIRAEAIPLDVMFENEDLIVVNKPAGMVVHPSAGHLTGTLVHAALGHSPGLQGVGGEQRPGVVHRLDKDTSGLILLAKNDRIHLYLQEQFRHRKIEKVYLALVDGRPPTPKGRVEAAIGRDVHSRKRMAITSPEKGRPAVSEYRMLREFQSHTLVEVHPITGRTHQIRLHLAFLGCPVAGDKVYGHKNPTIPIDRQFLHAERLVVLLPGETEPHSFHAPLPQDLQNVLALLEQIEESTNKKPADSGMR